MKRTGMQTYEPMAGEHIDKAAEAMVKLANDTGQPVTGMFNEISLDAAPGSDPAAIVKAYHEQRQREAKETQERKERELAAALAISPEKPTMRDEAGWQKSLDANTDDYGAAGMRYADKWARIMEGRIAAGETLESCADAASHLADDEGITGFMYGCAVSLLGQCWIHGEALRRWHNLKTQIGNEGEKANETGGTLNPALLNIGG